MTFLLSTYLLQFLGQPYVWGGHGGADGGFDCSGFVLEGLSALGYWGTRDATSQDLFNHFSHLEAPLDRIYPNDLLFFGKDKSSIVHVSVAIDSRFVIEAGGGSKSKKSGLVRIRPINFRKDLIAIVRLP